MTVTENKGFLFSDNIIHTEMPTTALRRSKVIRHRQLRLTLMLNFPLYFMSLLKMVCILDRTNVLTAHGTIN